MRDSAQDELVFSVSFRRYNRSLHARTEESRHEFNFDCHDPEGEKERRRSKGVWYVNAMVMVARWLWPDF